MSDSNLRPQAKEPIQRRTLALEVFDCSGLAPLSVGPCGFCCFSFAEDED